MNTSEHLNILKSIANHQSEFIFAPVSENGLQKEDTLSTAKLRTTLQVLRRSAKVPRPPEKSHPPDASLDNTIPGRKDARPVGP